MTKIEVVNELGKVIAQHKYYMDIYLAAAAAKLMGRPETEILGVLRSGGNIEAACSDLVRFFQESSEFPLPDLIGFITSHTPVCVYGVLVGQQWDKNNP